MNWAIIAPDSRLFKGKDLFRWDVSPGLDHHCGVCATPLHNSRAKSSCIGKHVEPCYRFHQQLHFIGKSHDCFGCNHSDEMHHNRHKEILTLVRKIATLDNINHSSLAGSESPFLDNSRQLSAITSTTTPTDASSDIGDEALKMKRSERKKAKKMGLGATKRRKVEAFTKEDIDFISEALHDSIHDTKGGWEKTYFYGNKQPKLEQAITEDEEVEDIIDRTASLTVKNLGAVSTSHNMTPRQKKCTKKLTNPILRHGYRRGSRKFSMIGLSNDPLDGVDPQVFFRLGIEIVNPVKNSVARKYLVSKLVAIIKNDIGIITQEEEETKMRAEGFWRWTGKTAYLEVIKRREESGWATGQKIGQPKKEALYYDREFADQVMNTDIQDRDDAATGPQQKIEAPLDDEHPAINAKVDFAVTEPAIVAVEERIEKYAQESEIPKHAIRKRRKAGSKVFRTQGKLGGAVTLRIVSGV